MYRELLKDNKILVSALVILLILSVLQTLYGLW